MENKKRIEWLDIARGICIILMVVCHYSGCNNKWQAFNGLTGYFFLVFFFFSAGICFNKKRSNTEFIIKQFEKLIIPYFLVSTFNLAIAYIRLNHGIIESVISFLYSYSNSFVIGGYTTYGVGPVWFLTCFFVATCIYKIVDSTVKNNAIKSIVIILLSLLSFISTKYFIMPFAVQSACFGCVYILLGDVYKEKMMPLLEKVEKISSIKMLLICIAISFCYIFVCYYMYIVFKDKLIIDMGSCKLSIISIPISVLGILLVITISMIIDRTKYINKIIRMYGRETFLILILHSLDISSIRTWSNRNVFFLIGTLVIYLFLSIFLRSAINFIKGKIPNIKEKTQL